MPSLLHLISEVLQLLLHLNKDIVFQAEDVFKQGLRNKVCYVSMERDIVEYPNHYQFYTIYWLNYFLLAVKQDG